jgi:hypothetical protein
MDALSTALTEAEQVEAEQTLAESQDKLDKEKERIKGEVEDATAITEMFLNIGKAAIAKEGPGDVVVDMLKFAATKYFEGYHTNKDSFKEMEAQLKQAKDRVSSLKSLAAAKRVREKMSKVKTAMKALEQKIREISKHNSDLERAERDLTIEMRNLGLDDAAGAIERRAGTREASMEMLVALTDYEEAIRGILPDATEVYDLFDTVQNDLGTIPDDTQRSEVESLCQHGKKPKVVLERQLPAIEQNRELIQSGHFEQLYEPVQKVLHRTQT